MCPTPALIPLDRIPSKRCCRRVQFHPTNTKDGVCAARQNFLLLFLDFLLQFIRKKHAYANCLTRELLASCVDVCPSHAARCASPPHILASGRESRHVHHMHKPSTEDGVREYE